MINKKAFSITKRFQKSSGYNLKHVGLRDEFFFVENDYDYFRDSYYYSFVEYPNSMLSDFPIWFKIKNITTDKVFKQLDISEGSGPENPDKWGEVEYHLKFTWKLTKYGNNYFLFVNDLVFKYLVAEDNWVQLQSIPFKTFNPKP